VKSRPLLSFRIVRNYIILFTRCYSLVYYHCKMLHLIFILGRCSLPVLCSVPPRPVPYQSFSQNYFTNLIIWLIFNAWYLLHNLTTGIRRVRVQSRRRPKNSISYEIRATKTSAYQAVKLGPLIWEMNNSFSETMLRMNKIYQTYHVFSFLYLLYDYFLSTG